MELAAIKRPLVRRSVSKILRYALLVLFSLFFLFPFFVMLVRSFMTDAEVLGFPAFFPNKLYLGAYARVFNLKMLYWFGNTMFIVAINMIGGALTASICGYGFAKIKFKGRGVWFAVMLSTIMLPGISMQIPQFILYTKIGWIGSLAPLVVPCFFGGGAMNIFLVRQFMRGVPNDISEAALLDGANSFRIMICIMFPLCRPIIVYMMVGAFLGIWNDFSNALIFLSSDERLYTLSLGLYMNFKASLSTDNLPNVQMATGILMIIPCMIVFLLFQKQLINGITMSAIKG